MDILIIVALTGSAAGALIGLPVMAWRRWQVAVGRKRLREYHRQLVADTLYLAARDAAATFDGFATATGSLGLTLEEFAEGWAKEMQEVTGP